MSREVYESRKPRLKDIIEGWDLDFYRGSIVKYVLRYPYDGEPIDDLVKLVDYGRMLLIREKRKELNEPKETSELTDEEVWSIIKEEYKI